jgi:hypothetical protein
MRTLVFPHAHETRKLSISLSSNPSRSHARARTVRRVTLEAVTEMEQETGKCRAEKTGDVRMVPAASEEKGRDEIWKGGTRILKRVRRMRARGVEDREVGREEEGEEWRDEWMDG